MFKESVSQKKKFLSSLIKAPMRALGNRAVEQWDGADNLTRLLHNELCKLPHCQLLYAVRMDGQQISCNVTRNGIDEKWLGQDLSMRPYLNDNLPYKGMVLSAVYLSQRSMQPCITALQAVTDDSKLLGFIAADFHVKDIPITNTSTLYRIQHEQRNHVKTRGNERLRSEIDKNIDYLIYVLSSLMQEHGIFQCQVYFDSGVCAISAFDDPYRYQLFNVQELMDPEIFELYPKADYCEQATIRSEQIPEVFAQLKVLRNIDDEIYIRSGSLNIINGQVAINLSCDGAHFMSVDTFLNSNLTSWLESDSLPQTQQDKIVTPN